MTIAPPENAAEPTLHSTCQEAHDLLSTTKYVACGAHGEYVIQSKYAGEPAYVMCAAHAYHNVNNRGARYVLADEKVELFGGVKPRDEASPIGDNSGDSKPFDTVFDEDDVEADPTQPRDEDLTRVRDLARRLVSAQRELERLEAEIKAKREEVEIIAERDLPLVMLEIGLRDFTLAGGYSIKIEDTLEASIPTGARTKDPEILARLMDKRAAWLKWLRDNGHDSIIKREVSMQFGKGQDVIAEKCAEEMSKTYPAGVLSTKESIAPQTLLKLVRNQLAAGTEFPPELGILQGHKAKVIAP